MRSVITVILLLLLSLVLVNLIIRYYITTAINGSENEQSYSRSLDQ